MATVSAALRIRAEICRRGCRPPVRGRDRVSLLTLCDDELLELHRRLMRAHRRGEGLSLVPLPAGVSLDQAAAMARVVSAPPVGHKAIVRPRAVEPRVGEPEAKLEQMVVVAEQAMGEAARWLARRVRPRS